MKMISMLHHDDGEMISIYISLLVISLLVSIILEFISFCLFLEITYDCFWLKILHVSLEYSIES